MQNVNDIIQDLQGFINQWNQLSQENSTKEYRTQYKPLSYYWRRVMATLDLPLKYDVALMDGFGQWQE